jgi:hypothetical protein
MDVTQSKVNRINDLLCYTNTLFNVYDQYKVVIRKWSSVTTILTFVSYVLIGGLILLVATLDNPVGVKWCLGTSFIALVIALVIKVLEIVFNFADLESSVKRVRDAYSAQVNKLRTLPWMSMPDETFEANIVSINRKLKELDKIQIPENILLFKHALHRISLPDDFNQDTMRLISGRNVSSTIVNHLQHLLTSKIKQINTDRDIAIKAARARIADEIRILGKDRVTQADIEKAARGVKEFVLVKTPETHWYDCFTTCKCQRSATAPTEPAATVESTEPTEPAEPASISVTTAIELIEQPFQEQIGTIQAQPMASDAV